MFHLLRKKRERKPTPPWMMWLAMAFLVFAFISSNAKKPVEKPKADAPEENKQFALGSLLKPEKIINTDIFKDKIFPQATIPLQSKNIEEGKGSPAICGQKVTIRYSSYTEDKKDVEKEKTTTFQIGEGKTIPALEKAVLGMKKSGKREVLSPSHLAYSASGFTRDDVPKLANIRFEMELLDLSPQLSDYDAYRIIGEIPRKAFIYTCGDQAKIKLSIWDIEGKKFYDTKDNNNDVPINFTIGNSEVFIGLEQGVLGMSKGDTRVLVVPPSLQKTINDNKSSIDFPFPKTQTVLVYLEAMP